MKRSTRYSQFVGGTLLCVLGVTACSEPVGPGSAVVREDAAVPARIEAIAGTGQSAPTGTGLAVSPAVVVRDVGGSPLGGVSVGFAVVRGGGSVERSSVVTDGSGVANAGVWKMGSVGANELEVTVGTLAPIRFGATSLEAVAPPSPYDITVRYIGLQTARQQQSVASAVARWRSIIVGELSNVPMNAAAGTCFAGQPALNEVVDDLLLYVEFVDIDGPGQVLGQAGPCFIRSDNNLPVVGYLKLDTSDLLKMEQTGTLDDVVLHEIGHVLGIGTLWPDASLLSGVGTADPSFTGSRALGAYRSLGGSAAGVPVENTGGAGTRDSHWRETDFGNELMTGYISATNNPLSAMTAQSLNDLGYGAVATRASTYILGGSRAGLQETVDLHGREKLERPKYKVDKYGRKDVLPN